MGWRGYKGTIDVGMLFRKMYCHKCGTKMKKSTSSTTTKKGEFGFGKRIAGKPTLGMSQRKDIFFVFICPSCGNTRTADYQTRISKLQKKLQKKILTDEEIFGN